MDAHHPSTQPADLGPDLLLDLLTGKPIPQLCQSHRISLQSLLTWFRSPDTQAALTDYLALLAIQHQALDAASQINALATLSALCANSASEVERRRAASDLLHSNRSSSRARRAQTTQAASAPTPCPHTPTPPHPFPEVSSHPFVTPSLALKLSNPAFGETAQSLIDIQPLKHAYQAAARREAAKSRANAHADHHASPQARTQTDAEINSVQDQSAGPSPRPTFNQLAAILPPLGKNYLNPFTPLNQTLSGFDECEHPRFRAELITRRERILVAQISELTNAGLYSKSQVEDAAHDIFNFYRRDAEPLPHAPPANTSCAADKASRASEMSNCQTNSMPRQSDPITRPRDQSPLIF